MPVQFVVEMPVCPVGGVTVISSTWWIASPPSSFLRIGFKSRSLTLLGLLSLSELGGLYQAIRACWETSFAKRGCLVASSGVLDQNHCVREMEAVLDSRFPSMSSM